MKARRCQAKGCAVRGVEVRRVSLSTTVVDVHVALCPACLEEAQRRSEGQGSRVRELVELDEAIEKKRREYRVAQLGQIYDVVIRNAARCTHPKGERTRGGRGLEACSRCGAVHLVDGQGVEILAWKPPETLHTLITIAVLDDGDPAKIRAMYQAAAGGTDADVEAIYELAAALEEDGDPADDVVDVRIGKGGAAKDLEAEKDAGEHAAGGAVKRTETLH